MKQNTTTKLYFVPFLFIVVFVFFGRGAPTAYAADVIQTCTSIVGDDCYINGGGAIGGSGYTSPGGNWDGTYNNVYPSFDTGLSNSWQNSNVLFDIDTLRTTLGTPTAFWARFKDMGGAGIDWVYQFYYDGSDYEQSFTNGVIINTPIGNSTLEDCASWNISWGNLGTGMKQMGMHYSDDATTLSDCEEFPYGSGAGYTDCINGSPRIWTDYGIATTVATGSANITKNTALTLGTTYYAQAVVQVTNSFGTNLAVSPIISFTIGIPTAGGVDPSSCNSFDLICYIQAGANWLFVPSQASLDNFKNLTLENSFPFSYLYDMGDLYDETFDQSAEDFEITIQLLGNDFTLISTDMLEAISFQSLVRTIMGAIALFLTGLFMYRKIVKIHDPHHQTV